MESLILLFGPTLARMLFALVLKDRVEFNFIQSGEIAETLADSIDIRGIVKHLSGNDRKAVRNAAYIFDSIGEEVAEQLAVVFKHERDSISEGELQQVQEAACDIMNRWTMPLLVDTRFDQTSFRRALRQKPPKYSGWSEQQSAL